LLCRNTGKTPVGVRIGLFVGLSLSGAPENFA
jgi:hypothetical protein